MLTWSDIWKSKEWQFPKSFPWITPPDDNLKLSLTDSGSRWLLGKWPYRSSHGLHGPTFQPLLRKTPRGKLNDSLLTLTNVRFKIAVAVCWSEGHSGSRGCRQQLLITTWTSRHILWKDDDHSEENLSLSLDKFTVTVTTALPPQ